MIMKIFLGCYSLYEKNFELAILTFYENYYENISRVFISCNTTSILYTEYKA